jgi:hypothetical protein
MVQIHCSVGSPEAHPSDRKSATVAQNIVLKVQLWAAKSRLHSTAAPSSRPIRQVYALLPVLIDSIRFLPPCSLDFYNIVSCLGDYGSTVPYRMSLLEVILFEVCRNL